MTQRTPSPQPPPTCPNSRAAPAAHLDQAILGYNHSPAYVRDVLARARAYARAGDEQLATKVGEPMDAIGCAKGDLAGLAGPANLREAERVTAPGAYRAVPSWALVGPLPASLIDARLYDDALWILRRYRLRVSCRTRSRHQHDRDSDHRHWSPEYA